MEDIVVDHQVAPLTSSVSFLLASLSVSVIAAHFLFYFFSLFSPMSCIYFYCQVPCYPSLSTFLDFPSLCGVQVCDATLKSHHDIWRKLAIMIGMPVLKYTNNILSVFVACRQQHFLVPKNEGHITSFLSNQLLPLITDCFIWSLNLLKQDAVVWSQCDSM